MYQTRPNIILSKTIGESLNLMMISEGYAQDDKARDCDLSGKVAGSDKASPKWAILST